jgi:hypothetical protein
VRDVLVQDERVLKLELRDGSAVTPEPAGGGEVVAVEPGELGRDLPVGAQLPVVNITCLTKV